MKEFEIGPGSGELHYDAADSLWILDMLSLAEAQSMTMGSDFARQTRARIAQHRAAVSARLPVPILTPEMPYAWYAIVTALGTAADYTVTLSGSDWSTDRRIIVTIDGRDHELTRVSRDPEGHREIVERALERIVREFPKDRTQRDEANRS
jgi:hypothetical protein